jgi:hypothetical protein
MNFKKKVYPNNLYNEKHYQMLKQMKKEMESWNCIVFDFLTAVDDGNDQQEWSSSH